MEIGLAIFITVAFLAILRILSLCKKINTDVEQIRAYFTRELDLVRSEISPISYFPLAEEAKELRRMKIATSDEFNRALEHWERLELREMEAFAETDPPINEPFPPSDSLRFALKCWSVTQAKSIIVHGWEVLFSDVFLDLLRGNITQEEAKQRLKEVHQLTLLRIEVHTTVGYVNGLDVDNHIEEVFNAWASRWEAGEWRERLNHLQDKKDEK